MSRPRLKIEMTRFDWALEAIAFLIWIGSLLFLILNFSNSPEMIPTHFNAAGNVDAVGSKNSIWLLVGIVTSMYILLTIINRYPHLFNYPTEITDKNARQQYTIATRMIRILKIIVIMIFAYIQLNSIIGTQLGVWFLPVLSMSIVVLVGFYLFNATNTTSKT